MRVLRKRNAAAKVGLGETAFLDGVKAGRWSQPIELGPKAVGWVEEELDACIAKLIAQRDGAEPAAEGQADEVAA